MSYLISASLGPAIETKNPITGALGLRYVRPSHYGIKLRSKGPLASYRDAVEVQVMSKDLWRVTSNDKGQVTTTDYRPRFGDKLALRGGFPAALAALTK